MFPTRLLLILSIPLALGVGCESDGPDGEDEVVLFGDGSHSLEGIDMTLIADSGDEMDIPRDLEFHPDRPSELWVVNRSTRSGSESVVIIDDPGTDDQAETRYNSFGAGHFMAQPSALAFSDNGNLATIHETDDLTQGPVNQGGTPADFMGPTLWTSDRQIFDGGHGGHLDMLHNTPNGMGIAWEEGNAFWVFDGEHDAIARYDFNEDHGPGGSDHSDGELLRFGEDEVEWEENVPSHMVYDHDTDELYVADTGNGRVCVLDTTSGDVGSDIQNYDGIRASNVDDARIETLISADDLDDFSQPSGVALKDEVLYVTDNRSGFLFAFALDGSVVDWVDLERDEGGLGGITFDEDGNLWLADIEAQEILKITLE